MKLAPNWAQPLALAAKITPKWPKYGPKWLKMAPKGPPKYCMVIPWPNVLDLGVIHTVLGH